MGRAGDNDPWLTIVGVVGDVRGFALEVKPKPQVYSPIEQDTQNEMTFVIRADAASARFVGEDRSRGNEIAGPRPAAGQFRTMESLVVDATARPRFQFLVSPGFVRRDGAVADHCWSLRRGCLRGKPADAGDRHPHGIGCHRAEHFCAHHPAGNGASTGGPRSPGIVAYALGANARFWSINSMKQKHRIPATFLGVALVLLLVVFLACWLPRRAVRPKSIRWRGTQIRMIQTRSAECGTKGK